MTEATAWVMIPKLDKDKTVIFGMVPLVLCKDCKWKGNSYKCRFDRDLEEHGSHRTDANDDWFCADGVKNNE